MSLRVYNTLNKSKAPFEPISPGKVGIYLCGPTVYKPSHIGHMVGPIIFDTIKRYLEYCGFDVTFVINVTDVDDKLINEAAERGTTVSQLAEEMTADYMKNLAAVGVDTVDHFPKATEHIDEIIAFVQTLVDKGFAYAADGDVYFEVGKDSEYGKLSGRSTDETRGEGGEMARRKRSTKDFALWKGAKQGEPAWESPWGPGRPGWHIECSAMSRKLLGESFDIHGGGLDLVFPHHENELAQSECCHGKPQARYWLHNGLMQAADEIGKLGGRDTHEDAAAADDDDQEKQAAGKISKSKNSGAFSELLERFDAETVRFFIVSTHYRRPIYYSESRLREVQTSLETFYRFLKRYERVTGESFHDIEPLRTRIEGDRHAAESPLAKKIAHHRARFIETMDDDFNTGGAIGDLFELVRALNRFIDQENLEGDGKNDPTKVAMLRASAATLRELSAVLGLFDSPREAQSGQDDLVDPLCGLLATIRTGAREDKNFALADKIRDALSGMRLVLEDRPGGTEWTRTADASAPEELAGKLMELLIAMRDEAREQRDFDLADKIRDGLTELGIKLEDRSDGTIWTIER